MSIFKKIKEHEEAAPATKATLSRSIVSTAFILTILTVAVVAYITSAWFSSNREANSTGARMNVDSSPNLVIALYNATGDEAIGSVGPTHNSVTFPTPVNTDADYALMTHLLTPVTNAIHKWDAEDTSTEPATPAGVYHNQTYTGLEYNTNPSEISPTTGYEKGSTAATFARAENPAYNAENIASKSVYYRDYQVCIASTDKPMTVSANNKYFKLNVTMDGTWDDMTAEAIAADKQFEYLYASSVDFYLGEVSYDNFVGKLNLKNQYTHTDQTPLDLFSQLASNDPLKTTIPLNTSDHIVVTMRMYFDGALEKTAANAQAEPAVVRDAFVYSSNLFDDNPVTLNVHFELAEENVP